jgi:uncharacterized membrane protein YhaH (DUF805 family)
MDNKKIWFRRKRYGLGWYPVTWEGWAVIFIWVVLFTSLVSTMKNHEGFKNIMFVVISVAVLIYICYKKGEPLHWQWGKKDETRRD